ncbi:MAG: FGGY-family carbohydrate kinase [Cyanothece sp. SIO1E1]|nr:FGGY-family carbohydrate kinase [Cyanothece sp. SIO1E1]
MNFYLGIDFGTSGARAITIDMNGEIQFQARYRFDHDADCNLTEVWQIALFALIAQIPQSICQQLQAIAINGTSATVLLCDAAGQPIAAPLLYNDARGQSVMGIVKAIAPPEHPVLSATSSLAKLLWWYRWGVWERESRGAGERGSGGAGEVGEYCYAADLISDQFPVPAQYFLHQADWLAFLLHGQLGISDYHNALKLGYDVGTLDYPQWLLGLPIAPLLPQVLTPGRAIAPVQPNIAEKYGFPAHCQVCAGTTDSIAAFLASGAQEPGEAVTSLGSTLVVKLLSHTRVDAAQYGIYSHRLGDLWLVGGASNTGGAVLSQFFTATELESLSRQINPDQASPLNYYPLTQPGERFPVNNPDLSPQLTPRPEHPVEFLHGLLESMARIESHAYQLLQDLGATPLQRVYTAGGGAKNSAWRVIRARQLGVPVLSSGQTEAAYGTALLALTKSVPPTPFPQ